MTDATTLPDRKGPESRVGLGLSSKLLVLTILFVMVSEVLIFVPSIANFRLTWLADRIATARVAALVLEAGPDGMVPEALERDLLAEVGAKMVAMKRGDARRLLAATEALASVHRSYDLRESRGAVAVPDAIEALLAPAGRVLRVIDSAPANGDFVEIVIDEAPLKAAMLRYSGNVLVLSLVISVLTASLVYLTLNRLLVRPMQKLTQSMVGFRRNPEDTTSRTTSLSRRGDELGQAERELAAMQRDLREMLRQKSRLAALGLAVSKINHDLRNLLATVQVLSDGIGRIEDPRVQRFAPKFMRALDRAIAFCESTLAYGQVREADPDRCLLPLHSFADEVAETIGLIPEHRVRWVNAVDPALEIDADPDQLFRVLLNLMRNAVQALERENPDPLPGQVRIAARREGAVVLIEVADTGPGVPDRVRSRLFEAFQGSTHAGGTGLGLAIAAELVRAHGGEIRLADGTLGATFQITIPDRVVDLAAAKRLRRSA